MGNTIASLNVSIGATLKGFDQAMGRLEGRLGKLASKLQSSGRALTAGVTVPLGIAGGAAVKFAATFDQAMARSTAIMGDAGQTMRGELEAVARSVARDAVQSSAEVAQSYYYLASAGLDAAQSMAALPQVVKFATAGNFDLAVATDLATDAQSALGYTVKDAEQNLKNLVRVTDVLVGANTLANASTQQFSEALTTRAGAALRLVGKDIEEGAAVLAAWADQGVKGAEAGTRLDVVLRDLQRAAVAARSSHREFYEAVYDSSGEMRNLADIVQWLERYLGGMSDAQRRVAISMLGMQERSVGATLSLVGLSGRIREYEDRLMDMAGVTDVVAARSTDNFADRLKILWGRIEDVGITLGKALIPLLEDLATKFENVLQWVSSLLEDFGKWEKSLRGTVIQLGLLAMAIGPILIILGKLVGVIKAITGALVSLFLVFSAHPIGLIITLLAGAALVFSGLLDDLERALGLSEQLGAKVEAEVDKTEEAIAALKEEMSEAEVVAGRLTLQIQQLSDKMTIFDTFEDYLISLRIQALRDDLAAVNDQMARLKSQIESLRSGGGGEGFALWDAVSAAYSGLESLADSAEAGLVRVREGVISTAATIKNMSIEVETAKTTFQQWAFEVSQIGVNFAKAATSLIEGTVTSMSNGIGDALAQAVVYGKDFGEAFKQMWLSVAAQAISSLVSMGIQLLIYWALSRTVLAGLAAGHILTMGSRAFAGASASVWETMPWFVASWLAPLVGAGAHAQTIGGLAGAALAEGGLVTRPMLGLIGEAGPELVLPLDRMSDVIGHGPTAINLFLDGEAIARRVVRRLPSVLDVDLGLGGIL